MKAVAWAWTWHSCPDWSFSLASLSPSQPSKKYCYCRTAMLRDLYGCWICTRKTHEKPPSERNQIWSSCSDTGRKQLAWYGSWNGSGTLIRFNSFHSSSFHGSIGGDSPCLHILPKCLCTFCLHYVLEMALGHVWNIQQHAYSYLREVQVDCFAYIIFCSRAWHHLEMGETLCSMQLSLFMYVCTCSTW